MSDMDEVAMQTVVAEKVSKVFDKIAENLYRSRAAHMKFLIEKEVYENMPDEKRRKNDK